MDVDARQVRRLDHRIVESRLLGELLGDEGLAASRRAVEQHTVGNRQTIFERPLPILQHIDHFRPQQLLQLLHSRHVGKTVALALGEGRTRGFAFGLSAALFPIGRNIAVRRRRRSGFALGRRHLHLLAAQRPDKLVGTAETVAVDQRQGALQHLVQLFGHPLRLFLRKAKPRLARLTQLFARLRGRFRRIAAPRQTPVDHLVKQHADRKEVGQFGVDSDEGFGRTIAQFQIGGLEIGTPHHRMREMPHIDDPGPEQGIAHAVVHDVACRYIVMNQRFRLTVQVAQPFQHTDRQLDGLRYWQPVFAAQQLGQQTALNVIGNQVGVPFVADRLDPRAPAGHQRRVLQPCAHLHLERHSSFREPRGGNPFQIEDFQEERLFPNIADAVGLGTTSLLDKKTHDIAAGERIVIL